MLTCLTDHTKFKWICLTENISEKPKATIDYNDVGTLLHGTLFAYQKAIKEFLGTGSSVFVHPVLDIIRKISERTGVNLVQGSTVDEVFGNLSAIMPTSGIMKAFRFEKLTPQRYVLHVEECVWAPHIHQELNPKDVACPFALLAMAVFEEVSKGEIKVVDSEYSKNGTKTTIELL